MVGRVVADTNVFYYLGSGALSLEDACGSPNAELYATPVNVLEIVSSCRLKGYGEKRAAAQAIVEHSTAMLPDPETHLVSLIDGTPAPSHNPWIEIAQTMAKAKSLEELERAVPYPEEGVVRMVDAASAERDRSVFYERFAGNMADVCDRYVPGYAEAFLNRSQAPKARKERRGELRRQLHSSEYRAHVIKGALLERYSALTGKQPPLADKPRLEALERDLLPYAGVYGAYVSELLTTGRKPEPNDWGDLELFLYLQPQWVVSTAEKKWWTLGKAGGVPEQSIVQVVASQQSVAGCGQALLVEEE